MITILLVDDHPVLRHGIRALLEQQHDFEVVGSTGDPAEAAALVAGARASAAAVNVALVDLDLGPGVPDGAEATRMIVRASPSTRVIAFTAFDSDADIVRMIDAGASGYLVKDSEPTAVFRAIRQAASGAPAIAGSISERLITRMTQPGGALTPRELDVLELAASGRSNRDLALRLQVSEATVKTHLHHAFTKLGVTNRQAAIATAVRQGIIRGTARGANVRDQPKD